MPVDREVPLSGKLPYKSLVHRNTDQVRHEFRQSKIVISFDPDDFDSSFGIGELADVGEELPVVAGKPREIEIGKDVAEQDQPPVSERLQEFERVSCPAYFRAEVHVGDDQRIE